MGKADISRTSLRSIIMAINISANAMEETSGIVATKLIIIVRHDNLITRYWSTEHRRALLLHIAVNVLDSILPDCSN